MRLWYPLLALGILPALGCAAPNDDTQSASNDLSSMPSIGGESAQALMNALAKVDAPLDTPAGTVNVISREARLDLTQRQEAPYSSRTRRATLSTTDGEMLGTISESKWDSLTEALDAAGVQAQPLPGPEHSLSYRWFAKVTCQQATAPAGAPTCTVSPISLTAADSSALMHALVAGNAPTNDSGGAAGVSSRMAHLKLATLALDERVTRSATLETTDGKPLADLSTLDTTWDALDAALLDAGGVWKGIRAPGSGSAYAVRATIACTQAPSAQPECTVTLDADK